MESLWGRAPSATAASTVPGTTSEYRTVPLRRQDIEQIVNSTRHRAAGVERAGGGVCFRARSKRSTWTSTPGQEGPGPGADRSAAPTRPALAHAKAALAHSQGRPGTRRGPLGAGGPQRETGPSSSNRPRPSPKPISISAVTDRQVASKRRSSWPMRTSEECEADLDTAKTNLKFTQIRSPVDGIVIDRKVDPGQTVASQFQTPVHVRRRPGLGEEGLRLCLGRRGRHRPDPRGPAAETAGHLHGGCLSATTSSGEDRRRCASIRPRCRTSSPTRWWWKSPNPGIKLLPGMTANLSFQIEKRAGVLTVPNAALRIPSPARAGLPARPGGYWKARPATNGEARPLARRARLPPAVVRPSPASARNPQRYVWIVEGRPAVRRRRSMTGLSDKGFTESSPAELSEGQKWWWHADSGQQTSSTELTMNFLLILRVALRTLGQEQDSRRPDGAGDRHRRGRRHPAGLRSASRPA